MSRRKAFRLGVPACLFGSCSPYQSCQSHQPRNYQNKSSMITKIQSERLLPQAPAGNEEAAEGALSHSASLNCAEDSPHKQCGAKDKVFSRKPDAQGSNLKSFKLVRRKSHEKMEKNSHRGKYDQPPHSPRSAQETKQEEKTEASGQSLAASLAEETAAESELKRSDSGVRFKKKAMSKEEIIEVKAFIRGGEQEKYETISIAGSEKGTKDGSGEEASKEANKKYKTEHFNFADVHGSPHKGVDVPENSSESDRFIASLRDKCQSADENSILLQKRLKWLRDEVEMHLQRQLEFKSEQLELEERLRSRERLLVLEQEKNQQVEQELGAKIGEVNRLKKLVVELNQKFDSDREIYVSEIEFLKSEKELEMEEMERKFQEEIGSLQGQLEILGGEAEGGEQFKKQESVIKNFYSQDTVERLVSENKYLKMENHILARCKDDLAQAKKQNRRIQNERDGLKKKIIEGARREAMRMRAFEDSDSSQTVTLSELSYSLSSRQS